jgi:hypothetical protein
MSLASTLLQRAILASQVSFDTPASFSHQLDHPRVRFGILIDVSLSGSEVTVPG